MNFENDITKLWRLISPGTPVNIETYCKNDSNRNEHQFQYSRLGIKYQLCSTRYFFLDIEVLLLLLNLSLKLDENKKISKTIFTENREFQSILYCTI